MWRRSLVIPQLDEVVGLLAGLGTMLMQIDAKLERLLFMLEEEE